MDGHALPETTKKIEKILCFNTRQIYKIRSFGVGEKSKLIETYNPQADYIKRIKKLVNSACLLMVEAVAMSKKSLAGLFKDIKKLTGETSTSRLNFCLPLETMDIFRNTLETKPPESIAGMRVQKDITIDGHKFILDDNT